MNPNATGRFSAEPSADFAQYAIDKAEEERKKAVPEGDWPLKWRVRLDRSDES